MAEVDKLTGFLTHKYFVERLEEETLRVKRYKGSLSLLMCEINYDYVEKKYDVKTQLSYAVLKQIGALFPTVLRDVDLIARYEGDTLVVMLPETDEEGAKLAAERLRKKVESHEFKGDDRRKLFYIAISIGTATFFRHAKTAHELVVAAQKGLQLALAKGGNCVEPCPVILEETPS